MKHCADKRPRNPYGIAGGYPAHGLYTIIAGARAILTVRTGNFCDNPSTDDKHAKSPRVFRTLTEAKQRGASASLGVADTGGNRPLQGELGGHRREGFPTMVAVAIAYGRSHWPISTSANQAEFDAQMLRQDNNQKSGQVNGGRGGNANRPS